MRVSAAGDAAEVTVSKQTRRDEYLTSFTSQARSFFFVLVYNVYDDAKTYKRSSYRYYYMLIDFSFCTFGN